MPPLVACMASRKSEGTPAQAYYNFKMTDPSQLTTPLENLRISSEPSCCTGASGDSAYVTALAFETESPIPSSTTFFPACSEPLSCEKTKVESEDDLSVEETIERSKVHWSQLIEHLKFDEDEAEVSNVKVFRSLQKHPTWGHFFRTFGDGGIIDCGELKVGKKFAAGGQAELCHAHVTWNSSKNNSYCKEQELNYVLKVFRKGTFLRDLQKQWPQGIFRQYEEILKRLKCGESNPAYTCHVECGTLLPDGRFAFLLVKENEDLRALIDCRVKVGVGIDVGPFSRKLEIDIMYRVAKGMLELHNLNIVHRDLKTSNVLHSWVIKKMGTYTIDFSVVNGEFVTGDHYGIYVVDYECSNGVVGIGFFRAPEILQAIKDKVVNKNSILFSKEVDVYSYGMVCYEILTGRLPFEGHRKNDYGLVLEGSRPKVLHYVEEWTRDLMCRCWQSNPVARPTFREIVDLLEPYSKHWNG